MGWGGRGGGAPNIMSKNLDKTAGRPIKEAISFIEITVFSVDVTGLIVWFGGIRF